MVRLGKKKEKFVRIKVGSSETGSKGFHAPIKTISVSGLTVDEVNDIILKALEKRIK